MQCIDQPDGSSRTITTEIQYCPPGTYCDHNYGEYECDSPEIPDDSTTTRGMWFYFRFSVELFENTESLHSMLVLAVEDIIGDCLGDC